MLVIVFLYLSWFPLIHIMVILDMTINYVKLPALFSNNLEFHCKTILYICVFIITAELQDLLTSLCSWVPKENFWFMLVSLIQHGSIWSSASSLLFSLFYIKKLHKKTTILYRVIRQNAVDLQIPDFQKQKSRVF